MKHHGATLLAASAILCMVVAATCADNYYVDQGATGLLTGENWTNAFKTIQGGIDACSGTSADTVHVAASTYIENLVLKSHVTLLGGYSPGGGIREPAMNTTTIDGGFAGPVVTLISVSDVKIDGFTITNGSAAEGDGIYCCDSSPTIANNTITENSGGNYGGGICCYYYSSANIVNNTITGNSVDGIGGGICCNYFSSPKISNNAITDNSAICGGGVFCYGGSSPKISDNTIADNSASGYGGGICCYCCSSANIINNTIADNSGLDGGGGVFCYDNCSPTITNNGITGNSTGWFGGGIYCCYSSPRITNCLITHNESVNNGGGIWCYYQCNPTLTNCTIGYNRADSKGGGIYFHDSSCAAVLLNCILWGDSPNEIPRNTTGLVVTYSDIEGAWTGAGNLNEYPQFCSRGGDTNYDGYFLKQENDGQGWPSAEWSPCIDAGDPGYDSFGGASNTEYSTAPNGLLDTNRMDMGYHYIYGGSSYAALVSFTARPVGSRIMLNWQTGAEIDNAGFVIYSAIAGTSDYQQLSDLIPARGTPTSGASYSFTDSDVEPGVSYNYWLVDIDTTGKWTVHGPASARLPLSIKPIQLPAANCQQALAR